MDDSNRTYRVAVIGRTGKGDYGHSLDLTWRDVPRTEVVAVCDDNSKGLAEAQKRLKVDRGFADYRAMLEEIKPDIVTIANRWSDRHAEMALACVERGIHVYIEKPFCRTLAEADEIIRQCQMTHARLAVAHTGRYSPSLQTARKLIDEGAIGTVIEYRGRGKDDHRGGGEDLWVLGSHILNMTFALAGKPTWCFAHIEQNGKPISKADVKPGNEGLGPLAGDNLRAMFGLPGGATASFQSTKGLAGKPSRFGLQIYGSKGIIDLDPAYGSAVLLLEDGGWSPARSGVAWKKIEGTTPASDAQRSGNVAAGRDLIDAIENQREPLCSAKDGRDVVEAIFAVFESQRLGNPVTFPLAVKSHPLESLT